MGKSSILNQYCGICNDVVNGFTAKVNKSFKSFLMETLVLYMVIPGRINFLQLGRYSAFSEKRFRRNFSKEVDWLSVNLKLAQRILTGERKAIAIDPSYISKSGKSTPWIGYFWSGSAASVKRGLEILGVGLIDVDQKDCVSLEAIQTPNTKALECSGLTLVDWYLFALDGIKKKLLPVTQYVLADAYFSKKTFADGLLEQGFHLISRFRDDAVLRYPTLDKPTGKKGRPRCFDGKIDFENMEKERFEELDLSMDQGKLYSIIAYSKSLKQMVRLVVWFSQDGRKRKLYFSTDTAMSGKDVIEYYRTRFQIEFCFRNAKQFTGLNHSQSRKIERLRFNFNASLTAVNIGKVLAKERDIPFSMPSLKRMIYNEYLLQRFICAFGIKPNKTLNDKLIKELIEFDAIAA